MLAEYDQLTARHAERLAELSVILERAQEESRALDQRRSELQAVRARVDARLRRLEQSQRATGDRLAELRQREQALGRLMEVLATRERLTGDEDIRRYRGALPWPVEGEVVQVFGRHYLPKYATPKAYNAILDDMYNGKVEGLFVMGANILTSSPQAVVDVLLMGDHKEGMRFPRLPDNAGEQGSGCCHSRLINDPDLACS